MADSRMHKQGKATLKFAGGPGVVLRLNPNAVQWNFKINTAVTETVGGRVVQVLGASLSDLTIQGSFGESRGKTHTESRIYAERFLTKMKEMAAYQSRDARKMEHMHLPASFIYPAKGWHFMVYIKDLTDPDGGGGVTHRPGKFSYDYVLTLMVHADMSDTSKILGKSNGVIATAKDKAVASYISRIADGIGWHYSQYNGDTGNDTIIADGTGKNQSSANATARASGKTVPSGSHTTGDKAGER